MLSQMAGFLSLFFFFFLLSNIPLEMYHTFLSIYPSMDIYVAFNFGYCKYWNEPGQGWGGSFQITIFFPLDKYPLVSLVDHDI